MAASSIATGNANGDLLQSYKNTVGGTAVQSEAVTLTDQTGNPITTTNPTPVNLQGEAFGTFGYLAGSLSSSNSSVTVGATSRMVALRIFPTGNDCSFNLNGGQTVTVRLNSGLDWTARSIVLGPTLNWVSGTFDYLIETA